MRQTESKHEQLKKQNDQLYRKFVELQSEARTVKSSLDSAERELSSTKKMLAK
jgi:uncharacterized coiled-coil DUF342 family protein